MQYHKFLQYVQRKAEEEFPFPNKVVVHPILKNNNTRMDALTITHEGDKMSPVIYLAQYYNQYRSGKELSSIMDEILHISKSKKSSHMDYLPDVTNYYEIDGKISYKLINQKMNGELLKDIPHTVIADLATIYVLILKYDAEGVASVIITDSLMKEWDVSLDALNSKADINTPILFPYTIKGMNEIMRDIIGNDLAGYTGEKASDNEPNNYEDDLVKLVNADQEEMMYVLSNSNGINGASALLYPNVLHDFAVKMHSEKLYILPSSVHETIILPGRGSFDKKALKCMVEDVNQTQVPQDEILSNEVYVYSLVSDKIEIMGD
jgi:hypothetical protein